MSDELENLRRYARRASIALAGLSGGGSELFETIGGDLYATPELCRKLAEEKLAHAWKYGGKAA